MKFIVSKKNIFKSLSHLQGVVDKKNSLPILSNILLEATDNKLVLSSTDMDISIIESIDCEVLEEGATTINSQIFYDVIRKLSDESNVEIISNDSKRLTIRSNKSKFSLSCLPKEDFPIIENKRNGNKLTINSGTLFRLIDKTKFAISNEETRYFLNGLYFNVKNSNGNNLITLVGTDGHRLATNSSLLDSKFEEIPGVIIPRKTINELYKLLSENDQIIEIDITQNKINFYFKSIILSSKLIDGNFPDYQRVIPKENNNLLEINRSDLLNAVDRVGTVANEKSPVIKLKLLENIINLSTINNDNSTATEDIKCSYNGDDIEIGFNSRYIMDIINNLENENILIKFKDSSSPIIVVENTNPDLIYVLMPMRV